MMRARLMLIAVLLLPGCSTPARFRDPTAALDPQQRLQRGNERFVSGHATHPHLDPELRRTLTREGQHPFATVLACSDSRVPVELLFDQGVGDLFVIRVAGNVVAGDETGSVEYAVEHLDCPLVVVLGHRDCGAVTAAVAHQDDTPSILSLLRHIEPAVARVRRDQSHLKGADLIARAVEENVWHSIEDLLTTSELARHRVRAGKLQVVGAIYDIESGRVQWLGAHPQQAHLAQGPEDATFSGGSHHTP